jgi:alpha-glucosidase
MQAAGPASAPNMGDCEKSGDCDRPPLNVARRNLADPSALTLRGRARVRREQNCLNSKWWQRAVIYQIAPMSFQDHDGDGKGDLKGIIKRLPYLEWLGIDAVWLCPIYPSPMLDFGYDIIDFCDIDPLFGTLGDFDTLLEEMHARDIKLLLDFVPNHTSADHPWFMASKSSRSSPKRDWYIWADPAQDGGPPNNWLSRFGGSAWAWSDATQQYYYHAFLPDQPDLNWRNTEVRRAMAGVLRFWLRRGVDGFRVDASAVLIEDDRGIGHILGPSKIPTGLPVVQGSFRDAVLAC